jgi:hypothetical protein
VTRDDNQLNSREVKERHERPKSRSRSAVAQLRETLAHLPHNNIIVPPADWLNQNGAKSRDHVAHQLVKSSEITHAQTASLDPQVVQKKWVQQVVKSALVQRDLNSALPMTTLPNQLIPLQQTSKPDTPSSELNYHSEIQSYKTGQLNRPPEQQTWFGITKGCSPCLEKSRFDLFYCLYI